VQETRNKHTTNKRPAIPRPSTSALLVAGAVFIFLVGGFVAFDSWRTNRAAEAAAKKMGSTTTHTTANNQAPDEAAPVTTAPTENDITAYEVAPSKPRLLTIPKIGVKARIVPEGVTKDGSLAAPGNVHDAGWYTSSSLPGQPGAMLLDGHVSSWTTNGVFYSLKKLAVGDVISVERGDGKILQYKVVKSQSYDAASVDMQAAVTPVVPGTPGLNLITCTGKVKPGTSDFSERLVVFTKQIN
jgi:LPXTG-site transpeptidase (sortase) family protein